MVMANLLFCICRTFLDFDFSTYIIHIAHMILMLIIIKYCRKISHMMLMLIMIKYCRSFNRLFYCRSLPHIVQNFPPTPESPELPSPLGSNFHIHLFYQSHFFLSISQLLSKMHKTVPNQIHQQNSI